MNRSSWLESEGEDWLADILWDDGERKFCRVWRSEADGDRKACIAIVPSPKQAYGGNPELLASEYALKQYIDAAWGLRPLALVRERGRVALVVEDQGGQPLSTQIARPMEIGEFLRVAVAAAGALAGLHERGLIHKDIKPSNLIVNPARQRVWLTGFGVATLLEREHQSPDPPELIAGTLPYMAPEQTGRMNRSTDSRADLYSLGVTLYQALTGSLPFTASDPMEWVHCHIAREPPSPKERLIDLPPQLSAIIMKLLAKTPEERYQTAAGVMRDLQRCLADWESQRVIEEFPLGELDHPDRLRIPEHLYGRDSEIRSLLASFDDVIANGTPQLVIVRGAPGIGKSSVVNELHKVLVPPRGLFASGKFDQLKRNIPYASLAQPLQTLIRQLLSKPEAELSKWRDELRQALDPNPGLITELIPELKLIIGEQPTVADFSPLDAKARFQLTLSRLIGVFARPEHPLALFLDDLQWLDAGTLDLLEMLLHPDVGHLLLVGAYRDNEVDPAHPLARKLLAIRQSGATLREITLEPLDRDDLTTFIKDTLHCEPLQAKDLAQLVHEKTAGNPFFANHFVQELAEEGLVRFNPGTASWHWDLGPIHEKGYSANVVDLMIGRLARLPLPTQKALSELACLGIVAKTSTLAIVYGASEEDVHDHLWAALRSELITRSQDTYRFLHDRIQEAAYTLIPKDLRPHAHLRIGRLLRAQIPDERQQENIFEVVGHLNRGSTLITSQEEREGLAELNLVAGKRAKGATAYDEALNYLMTGSALLGEDCWEGRHDLIFALELHRAECEFLTGQVTSAEERLVALSSRCADTVERAAVTCLLADVYVALRRVDRSVAACLEYLGQAGLRIPTLPNQPETQAAYDRVWSKLGGRSIEELTELPLMADPASIATLDVLAKIARSALTQMDMKLLSVVLCAAVELCLERGNTDSSCYAYGYFGVVAAWHFGDFEAGFRFGRLAHDLVETKGLRQYEALVCLTLANRVMPWAKHVGHCRELIRKSSNLADKSGDRISAVSSRCVIVSNLLIAGDPLAEVETEAEAGLAFCRRTGFRDFIDAAETQAALIRNLRGKTRRFGCLDDDRFDEIRMQDHFASQPHVAVFECWYWIRLLQARFLAGDYIAALDASDRAQALLFSSAALLEVAEYELYSALSHAGVCAGASADERQQHLRTLDSHHARLDVWAQHCPENFENRAALVAAEIARLDGRDSDAMQAYERAIRSARENGFVHNEALALELAAFFYASRGFDRIARAYMRDARNGYREWGADGKTRQLEEQYPYLRQDHLPFDSARTLQTPLEQLDLDTVLKVQEAVSGETDLQRLIATVMRLGLEQAGAARGLLIVPNNDTFQIAAEAAVSGGALSVASRAMAVTAESLPESVLQYALRTRKALRLNDAFAESPFCEDLYVRRHRARSVLCIPLLKQERVLGVIYLENNLAAGVFAPAQMPLLKLLASQAAVSLENARLYRDLHEREAKVRRLVDSNIIGIVIWHADDRIIDANEAFLRIVGYDREDLLSGRVRWTDIGPPEWDNYDVETLEGTKKAGAVQAREREYIRRDGSRVPVLAAGALFDGASQEGVAFVLDLTDRKRAEQARRDTERESRLILDTIPGMVGLLSDKGHVDVVNRPLLDYFGQTLDELREWATNGTVHPADVVHVADIFTRSIASGIPYNIEQRFRRADGVYRWFENRGFPLRDETGRIVRWCVLLTDIDERRRAEDALKRSERNLKLTIDALPALTWSTSPDGAADFFNQHYLDFVGLSAEQASGWGWTTALHPDDLNGLAATWQRLVASGEPGEAEARLRRHDGAYRWFLFRASPLRDETGRILKWYGVNTEIEDRKKSEDALRRSEDFLLEIQRLALLGWWRYDVSRDVVVHSPEFYQAYGVQPGEDPGDSSFYFSVIHPDDRPRVQAEFERCLSTPADYRAAYRILRPDGSIVYHHSVGHPVTNDAGELVEFIGAVIDMTEQWRATTELERASEALRELQLRMSRAAQSATMGEFAASIAHEVNQPLSGIITNAGTGLRMLDAEPPNIDGARETVRRTLRDGKRAAEVIGRLRDLFSKKEITPKPLDLNEAIREVIALSLSGLQKSRVEVLSELAEDLPLVAGDRVQLQQVIQNLLLNAAEAMAEVSDRARELTIRTEREDGHCVRVTVRDSGVGVDLESLHKLFDPFYTTKSAGMGIGLSISRSIIERHKGRLWAEPNDGPGATFAFSIPCA